MGTSQSKPNPPPGAPLIPPWANQDPPPPEPPPEPAPDPTTQPEQPGPAPPQPPIDLAPPRRFAGFRTALGHFATSGNRDDARAALGHWARTSTGGARANTQRVSRAARTGGAALAGFARAAAGQPPVAGALDIRSLAGLSVDIAVDRIVDAFCPPGILDEDTARLAIGEGLTKALAGADTFDPNDIGVNDVRVATLTFVAELVFVSVAGDGGRALAAAPSPAAATQRESDIRSLVHEATDMVGTPILTAAGNVLTPDGMTALVSRVIEAVQTEMETW